jgi:hypothetical protein
MNWTSEQLSQFEQLARQAGVQSTMRQFRKWLRGEGQVAQWQLKEVQNSLNKLSATQERIRKSQNGLNKALR